MNDNSKSAVALAHLRLSVTHLSEAVEFFEAIGARANTQRENFVVVELRDRTRLQLTQSKEAIPAGNSLQFDFKVADIDAAWQDYQAGISTVAIKTERTERMVTMTRTVPDRPAAPFYQWAGKFKGNVDRWLITTVEMPAYVVNDAGCVDVGTDTRPGHREYGVEMRVLNAPTPETETTTHYFYTHARHFGLDDDAIEEAYKTQFTQVFLEDKVVLEAQQRSMTMKPDAPMVDINTDAPSIATREMLSELIDKENAPSVASAAE